MNFPEIMPVKYIYYTKLNLYPKCNKLDPYGYRNGQMEKKYVRRDSGGETTYELTDDQYYKIELLRIRILNHIAKCYHS